MCDLERISQAVDGELESAELAELHTHLEHCKGCREYYEFLMTLDETVSQDAEVPEHLHGAIMQTIRNEQKKSSPIAWLKKYRFTAIAAGLALVILAATYVGPFSENSAPASEEAPEAGVAEVRTMTVGTNTAAMPQTAFSTAPEASITEAEVDALEAAGLVGNIALAEGLSEAQMAAYNAFSTNDGRVMYEVSREELDRLVSEENVVILDVYEDENSDIYYVFLK